MFEKWKKRRARKQFIRKIMNKYPCETGNPYTAVIWKATQKMGAHVRRYGVMNKDQETARQYFLRMARIENMDVSALFGFCNILEESMFSNHDIGELQKNKAIELLRKIEFSLNSGTGKIGPNSLSGSPLLIPPKVEPIAFPYDRYPEVENIRTNLKIRVSELMNRTNKTSTNSVLQLSDENKNQIDQYLVEENYTALGKILRDLSKKYSGGQVYLSEFAALYLFELIIRLEELLILQREKCEHFLSIVLPASMVLSFYEERNYIIPDDVKISFLSMLPEYGMVGMNNTIDLLNSIPVPFVFYEEIEQEIRTRSM